MAFIDTNMTTAPNPHDPTKIVASNSEVKRLKDLLRRCPNLYWHGQQVKDIFSTTTTKEACEAEAAAILAEIDKELE